MVKSQRTGIKPAKGSTRMRLPGGKSEDPKIADRSVRDDKQSKRASSSQGSKSKRSEKGASGRGLVPKHSRRSAGSDMSAVTKQGSISQAQADRAVRAYLSERC